MSDDGCICKGNWRSICAEYVPNIDRTFRDKRGRDWLLFGIVHGGYDYYFGLTSKGETRILSCVGDLAAHGFDIVPTGLAGPANDARSEDKP